MQHLEVSGAVRPIYGSLGVKWLRTHSCWNYPINTNSTVKYFAVFTFLWLNFLLIDRVLCLIF